MAKSRRAKKRPKSRSPRNARVIIKEPRAKAGTTQIVVQEPELKPLRRGPNGELLPHLSRTPVKTQSTIARLPEIIVNWAWKYRWQLTPLAVGALVVYGQHSRSYTTAIALVLAVTLATFSWAWDKIPEEIFKRKWLSKRERQIASAWLGLALAASIINFGSFEMPLLWSIALTVALIAWPSIQWMLSRNKITGRQKISPKSKYYMTLWAKRVAIHSIGALQYSKILGGTAQEPMPATLTFKLQLRPGVHGAEAEGDGPQQSVETLLGLGTDTVEIKKDRDDSTRAKVTIAWGRHLEKNDLVWPGPQMTKDKKIPLGEALSGAGVLIPRQNVKGVVPMRVSGNTGNGKTSTARVICLECAFDQTPDGQWSEVLWTLDGKRGTSFPEIENVFDWYSIRDDEWPIVLDTFYDIMVQRQIRRGEQKLSMWRVTEDDPIISMYIAESSAVVKSIKRLGPKIKDKYDDMVLECLQHGRALGMCVRQEAQDAIGDNFLGGRQARELMSKGAAIMHRPGGFTGQTFARDGANEAVRLLSLPEEPGFAAVIVNGQVAADVMRVYWLDEMRSAEMAKGYVPRHLEGEDLRVAGTRYENRHQSTLGIALHSPTPARAPTRVDDPPGASHANAMQKVQSDKATDESSAADDVDDLDDVDPLTTREEEDDDLTLAELNRTDQWIIKVLTLHPEGLTMEDLVERGRGLRGRKQRNLYTRVGILMNMERIERDDELKYRIAGIDRDQDDDRDREGR